MSSQLDMGALSMDAPAAPAALDAPTRQKLAGFIEEACGVHVDSDEETDERAVSPPLAQLQMGCGPSGPSSYANEQEAMLVWATNWGLLSKPTNLPSWFSQQDMETIYRIGAPWGSVAVGRVISRSGDNAPLEQCRRELPHLRFEFEARSELGDQYGNPAWKHILYIYPHAARPPQVWATPVAAVPMAVVPVAIAPVPAVPASAIGDGIHLPTAA